MEHYVMISHFENEQDDQQFRELAVANYPRHKIEEHEDITAAVAKGDPEAARRTAETHITRGMARYLNMMERGDAVAS